MRIFPIIALAAVFAMFAVSCDNDFNPNAEWKETMVVYGLLDQDQDTTWVRVQKCYLGEGDMIAMSSIMDSSNYPEGDIEVSIVEWNATEKLSGELVKTTQTGKVLHFSYTMYQGKDSGDFYYPGQPIYYCPTRRQLDSTKVYELIVKNVKTGKTATAEASLIEGIGYISVNSNSGTFTFQSGTARMRWNNAKRARIYQPVVRFYYRYPDRDTLMYVDIKGVTVEAANELQLSAQMTQSFFGMELTKKIKDHNTLKLIGDSISLFMLIGDETLRSYMSASAPPNTLVQERGQYTNINGGIGVFAARRTRIKQEMPVPLPANDPYRRYIKGLGIGF